MGSNRRKRAGKEDWELSHDFFFPFQFSGFMLVWLGCQIVMIKATVYPWRSGGFYRWINYLNPKVFIPRRKFTDYAQTFNSSI